jgi:meso-butanediol dehydrogenase / (S,S)-butanediol dehydrogenase / diacetyl reductase
MAGRLEGKVAIITGTGSGMGRAAARIFAREGAKIVGCDINADHADAILQEVRAEGGDMVSIHPVDLGYAEGANAVVDLAIKTYGAIDIVYNNAAMAYFAWVPEMEFKAFNDTIREEVDIIFHLTKAAWPHMVARGGGSIVNIASGAGKMALPEQGALAHCAGKGAVIAMTRQYASEGGPHGIRANSISPGMVFSAQTAPFLANPEWKEKLLAKRMIKRGGEPEEVVYCALFLASDEASFVTGADFAVDGGSTAM